MSYDFQNNIYISIIIITIGPLNMTLQDSYYLQLNPFWTPRSSLTQRPAPFNPLLGISIANFVKES
jgi:hypothetical protein